MTASLTPGNALFSPVAAQVQSWVKSVAPDAVWVLDMGSIGTQTGGANAGSATVCTHLLDMLPASAGLTTDRSPLRLRLRFLVTAWATPLADAHELLARLALDAKTRGDWQMEREAVPLDFWQAVKLAPRPAFILQLPLDVALPVTTYPPVRQISITEQFNYGR